MNATQIDQAAEALAHLSSEVQADDESRASYLAGFSEGLQFATRPMDSSFADDAEAFERGYADASKAMGAAAS